MASEAVRALRRQMLLEMQAAEHGIGVDVENGIGGLAGVEGEQDGDQTAHDMGVAVADEAQARGARDSGLTVVASQTWLTQPCTLLMSFRSASGNG